MAGGETEHNKVNLGCLGMRDILVSDLALVIGQSSFILPSSGIAQVRHGSTY